MAARAAGAIRDAVSRAASEPVKDRPVEKPLDCEVVVVGGGPAGLAAAALCARKKLSTAVFEGDSWGGILTRWCPDKRIDNYPGVRPGILAGELGGLLADEARRAGARLVAERVESIARDGEVRAGPVKARGRVLILASGSTAAEAGIPKEKEFASRGGGIHYGVEDPASFRGKRVVVVGGGDTALSHVRRVARHAAAVTLVHRQRSLRGLSGEDGEDGRIRGAELLLGFQVDAFLGDRALEAVRIRDVATGGVFERPADAVVMAVGRRPNTSIFLDMDLALDGRGQIVADAWQRTNVPGVLAVGDVSSHLKMIVTAVAQAAVAAQRAYMDIRSPYWK